MKPQDERMPHCADCKIERTICRYEDGKGPASCPTLNLPEVIELSLKEYKKGENLEFAANASIQEAQCYVNGEKDNPHIRYAVKPRIQETIEFAHKMGYKRLGLAFCAGLKDEAKIVSDILKQQGFEVASVICKVGGTPKEFLGLLDEQKITPGEFETMCSPVTQAKVLNAASTDFNILMGLCVGHDSLMMRFSERLCTVLVVKDRVTGHNPLAAIQLHRSYYKKLSEEKFDRGESLSISAKPRP
ncbi:MAG: DUF1847 domain-containing protein [Syntrophobacteraceae bacterium]